jgi:hypothetical protein
VCARECVGPTVFRIDFLRPEVHTERQLPGHATAAETLDPYSHLWPDSDDRTRDAVDSVLSDLSDDDVDDDDDDDACGLSAHR